MTNSLSGVPTGVLGNVVSYLGPQEFASLSAINTAISGKCRSLLPGATNIAYSAEVFKRYPVEAICKIPVDNTFRVYREFFDRVFTNKKDYHGVCFVDSRVYRTLGLVAEVLAKEDYDITPQTAFVRVLFADSEARMEQDKCWHQFRCTYLSPEVLCNFPRFEYLPFNLVANLEAGQVLSFKWKDKTITARVLETAAPSFIGRTPEVEFSRPGSSVYTSLVKSSYYIQKMPTGTTESKEKKKEKVEKENIEE